jgi:hypothetical protein
LPCRWIVSGRGRRGRVRWVAGPCYHGRWRIFW